jgi:hypothetical protein
MIRGFGWTQSKKTRWVRMKADRFFLEKTSDIVEGLCNLTYLICDEADRPEKVRYYAGLSEQRLQSMIELLRAER